MGRVKRFLSKRIPKLNHIVIVESGDRGILEKLLPSLYSYCPHVDVVTCFAGPPLSFDAARGVIWNIADYQGREGRARLYTELWDKHYSAVGIVCADQPIMTRWKWAIAAQLPGKLFVINENVDYFWIDRGNWKMCVRFALFRAGLSGADAARTLTQLALFPFTVVFLLLYAGQVHARRRIQALTPGDR